MTTSPDRYGDLDAALAEEFGEPHVLRLLGKEWPLRVELPTKVVLLAQRQQSRALTEDVPEADTAELVDALLYPGAHADVIDAGAGPKQTDMLIAVAIKVYAGATCEQAIQDWKAERARVRKLVQAAADGTDAEGNPAGPTEAPTSSPTGD